MIRYFPAFVALLLAGPLGAQPHTLPLDFAAMPVGLLMVYSDDNGGWVEVYQGQQEGRYVIEHQTPSGAVTHHSYYNAQGLLVARHYANGNIRSFAPHHCERVIGRCSFDYANTSGSTGTLQVQTAPDGDGYVTTFWELDFAKTQLSFVPGQYNVSVSGVSPRGVAFKLVEIQQP